LALNFSWSLIFFRGHRPDLALVNIVALAVSIVVMMYYIRQLDPVAANLQIPYLLWVLFATTLNANIVSLNAA
jgi:tryptophan-rich sensory protein